MLSLYRFLLKLLPWKIKHKHLNYECPQSAHIAGVTLRLEHHTVLRFVGYIQTLTCTILCNRRGIGILCSTGFASSKQTTVSQKASRQTA